MNVHLSRIALGSIAGIAVIGLLGACGASDGPEPADQTPVVTPVGGDISAAIAAEAELPPVRESSARLTLANGEVLEFQIECDLTTQLIDSFEVLFLAHSTGSPTLKIRQDGDGGRGSQTAFIRVEDADAQAVWESASLYVNSGGTAALSLDGTTITGVGGFFPAADFEAEPIVGTLTAEC